MSNVCWGYYSIKNKRVVFGAYDPKGGSVETCTKLFDVKEYNHHPEYIGGILEPQCSQLLKDFFKEKERNQSKQNSYV